MTVEEIRSRKIELGFTTEQLSKISGVPVGTLQKILNGETKAPRYATLQALEEAFSVRSHIQKSLETYDLSYKPVNVVKESPAFYGFRDKRQGEYTVSDYFALPEEARFELIDGVLYEMQAPSMNHQEIVSYLVGSFRIFADKNSGSCKGYPAPLAVRLDEDDKTMVEPDFIVVCDNSRRRRWGIMGAPDFVVEIISKSTMRKDYLTKAAKYMNAGVRELWLIDPISHRLTIYFADPERPPYVGPLSGKMGVEIYDGEWEIDLDKIDELIEELPD